VRARAAWAASKGLWWFGLAVGVAFLLQCWNEGFQIQIVSPAKANGVGIIEYVSVFDIAKREQASAAHEPTDCNVIHNLTVDWRLEEIANCGFLVRPEQVGRVISGLFPVLRNRGQFIHASGVGAYLNDVGGCSPMVFQLEFNPKPDFRSRIVESLAAKGTLKACGCNEYLGSLSDEQCGLCDFGGSQRGVCGFVSATVGTEQKNTLHSSNDDEQEGKKRQQAVSNFEARPENVKGPVLANLLSAFVGVLISLPLGIIGGVLLLSGRVWIGGGCSVVALGLAFCSTIGLLFGLDLWSLAIRIL
jgi:hypothetical protein